MRGLGFKGWLLAPGEIIVTGLRAVNGPARKPYLLRYRGATRKSPTPSDLYRPRDTLFAVHGYFRGPSLHRCAWMPLSFRSELVLEDGIEPPTYCLQNSSSVTELLQRLICMADCSSEEQKTIQITLPPSPAPDTTGRTAQRGLGCPPKRASPACTGACATSGATKPTRTPACPPPKRIGVDGIRTRVLRRKGGCPGH